MGENNNENWALRIEGRGANSQNYKKYLEKIENRKFKSKMLEEKFEAGATKLHQKNESKNLRVSSAFKIKKIVKNKFDDQKQSVPEVNARSSSLIELDYRKSLELDYLQEWEKVNEEFNSRKVKVSAWVGESAITEDDKQQRDAFRAEILKKEEELTIKRITSRVETKVNEAFPIISKTIKEIEYSWDYSNVDRSRVRIMRLKKMINCINKVLTRQRAVKRIKAIKDYLQSLKNVVDTRDQIIMTSLNPKIYPMDRCSELNVFIDENKVEVDRSYIQSEVFFQRNKIEIKEFDLSWNEDFQLLENLKMNFIDLNSYQDYNPLNYDNFIPLNLNISKMKEGAFEELAFIR